MTRGRGKQCSRGWCPRRRGRRHRSRRAGRVGGCRTRATTVRRARATPRNPPQATQQADARDADDRDPRAGGRGQDAGAALEYAHPAPRSTRWSARWPRRPSSSNTTCTRWPTIWAQGRRRSGLFGFGKGGGAPRRSPHCRRSGCSCSTAQHQDAEAVAACLPAQHKGHVLVTTRNAQWRGLGTAGVLPAFERAESIAFLRHAGKAEHESLVSAGQLAKALGDYPWRWSWPSSSLPRSN